MDIGLNNLNNITFNGNEVQTLIYNGVTLWTKGPAPHDYSQDYLTFNILSNGTIGWKLKGSSNSKTIQYSKNNGETWTNLVANTSGVTINVTTGDTVLFKGTNTSYASSPTNYYNYFTSTCDFEVSGNIMSLIYGDNFIGQTTLTAAYTFNRLFLSCSKLLSVDNLILPATTLTDRCYMRLFNDCTGLTKGPVLPATTLVNGCYLAMFYGCTGLTQAPKLPATTLVSSCYGNMFYSCTSLTTAPELPATTLVTGCYDQMFWGCTNLNYVKAMFTTTPGTSYTPNWLSGVAATGTFVKNSAATWNVTGVNGIPTGWTIETAAS